MATVRSLGRLECVHSDELSATLQLTLGALELMGVDGGVIHFHQVGDLVLKGTGRNYELSESLALATRIHPLLSLFAALALYDTGAGMEVFCNKQESRNSIFIVLHPEDPVRDRKSYANFIARKLEKMWGEELAGS